MRTCITSRMSSNFDQIGQLTMELAALECLKKFPIGLLWENGVCMLAHSFLIKSSSKLLVTRTGIKAQMSLISGLWFPWPIYMFFEMRFDLGTLDSGERSLPFGLLVWFLINHESGNFFKATMMALSSIKDKDSLNANVGNVHVVAFRSSTGQTVKLT